MANRRGDTSNEPIDIDAIPDDSKGLPAPKLPGAKRRARPSHPPPHGVEVIALSDDEHDGQHDFEEVLPSAWAAAKTRREINHRTSNVDGGTTSLPRRESHLEVGVISRTPSANPHGYHRETVLRNDAGPTVALEETEHESPKESAPHTQQAATASRDNLPIAHSSAGLSERTKPPKISNIEAALPESLLNKPPTSAIPTQSAATVVPPIHKPADFSSVRAAPAPASTHIRDVTKSESTGNQVPDIMRGLTYDLNSPIGAFADHSRERTTSSRVNTGSAIEHANTEHEAAGDPSITSSMSAESLRSHVLGAARAQPKQKAKKTVKLREDRESSAGLPIKQHNRYPVDEALKQSKLQSRSAAPQNRVERSEPLIRRGRSKDASANINAAAAADTTVRLNTRNIADESPPTIPPRDDENEDFPLSIDDADRSSTPVAEPSARPSIVVTELCYRSPRGPNDEAVTKSSLSKPDNLLQSNTQTEDSKGVNSTSDVPAIPERQPILPDDASAMRSAVDACLGDILGERHRSHANLTEMRMKCQRTCQERELRAQRRQQKGPVPPALPEKYVQSISPFATISSKQVPFEKKANHGRFPDISQEIYTQAKPKDIVIRSGWVVPTTTYISEAVSIPAFKEYVSLKDNILADNESKLLATPYFQDEDDESRKKLLELLPRCYELKHDENGTLDLRIEQCRFYQDSIEAFLVKIGISWDDVLYWLLAPDSLIKVINNGSPGSSEFESLLLERSHYGIESFVRGDETLKAILFRRDSSKWQEFLPQLKEPTAKRLRLSAMVCAAVLRNCNFSIWYLAQQCETVVKHVSKKTRKPAAVSGFTYRDAVCRVCHQHNCLIHGELREVPEDCWESESEDDDSSARESATDDNQESDTEGKSSRPDSPSSSDEDDDDEDDDDTVPAHFDDDSDIEKLINYKLPANPNAFGAYAESEMIESKGSKPPDGKFNSQWWLQHSYTHIWEKRKPFFPCSHEGSCEQAQCRCYRENINCEKTCKCSRMCKRRFPGCNCASTPGKRTCALATCLCIKFKRECDADLCGTCGATEILDPVNRYNEDVIEGRCYNVAIQRAVPKKTLLGHSEVHGFGLYMGEDISKDEYIGEYLGETISVREGNRRLTIYEYQQTMYLFKLNAKQEVDATFMGNKMRFINNADKRFTNCYAKNLLCNTVFRLALYASTNIKAGTELYFDYNYPKETTQHFKQPKSKVVAVKETVKQTKPKAKSKSSESSMYKSSTSSTLGQRPDVHAYKLEALKKARAEKARLRAARLAEKAPRDPPSSRPSGPQRARKTAPENHSNRQQPSEVSRPHGKGVKTVRRSDSQDSNASDARMPLSTESQDTQTTSSTKVVQETDEEDIFDVPLSDNEGLQVGDVETGVAQRSRRSQRRRLSMAPVVAVKKRTAARLSGGRKRKRPVVFNSDDE